MTRNIFDWFSVFFTRETMFLNGTASPLDQPAADTLNRDSEVLTEIDQRVNHFISVVRTLLQEKTDSTARPEH